MVNTEDHDWPKCGKPVSVGGVLGHKGYVAIPPFLHIVSGTIRGEGTEGLGEPKAEEDLSQRVYSGHGRTSMFMNSWYCDCL